MKFILKFAVPGTRPSTFKSGKNFVISQSRGRCSKVVPVSELSLIEPIPTIRAAILGGSKLPLIPVARKFWRRCIRMARPKVTAMLVIDSSRSSREYLSKLSEILKTLFEKYTDPSSKIGMVVIEDGRAKLVFSPTRNRLRVFGRMKELSSGGYTPLADALKIARGELARLKMNDSSVKPFIILVSDCYPEPLPADVRDVYESDLYKKVRMEARLLRQKNIPVALIDPSSPHPDIAEKLPGRRLARFISNVSRGVYIEMPAISMYWGKNITPKFISEDMKKSKAYHIAAMLGKISDMGNRHLY